MVAFPSFCVFLEGDRGFLVACTRLYNSLCRLDSRSVTLSFCVHGRFLHYCSCPNAWLAFYYHCPRPPACDLGGHVSFFFFVSSRVHVTPSATMSVLRVDPFVCPILIPFSQMISTFPPPNWAWLALFWVALTGKFLDLESYNLFSFCFVCFVFSLARYSFLIA